MLLGKELKAIRTFIYREKDGIEAEKQRFRRKEDGLKSIGSSKCFSNGNVKMTSDGQGGCLQPMASANPCQEPPVSARPRQGQAPGHQLLASNIEPSHSIHIQHSITDKGKKEILIFTTTLKENRASIY